jgi:hypothetical protein
MSLVKKVKCRY